MIAGTAVLAFALSGAIVQPPTSFVRRSWSDPKPKPTALWQRSRAAGRVTSYELPVLRPDTVSFRADSRLTQIDTVHAKLSEAAVSGVEQLNTELASYERLEDGWDGQGAPAPDAAHIAAAQQLVFQLPSGIPLPRPMISGSGVIGLYWDAPDLFADVEIENGSKFSLFTKKRLKEGADETFDEDIAISSAARDFLSERLSFLCG